MFKLLSYFLTCLLLANIPVVNSTEYSNEVMYGVTDTKKDIVICGDSRVVGLASSDGVVINDNSVNGYNSDSSIYYLAEVGKGYDWLESNLYILDNICTENTVLYIALGINDLDNIDKYINLYSGLSERLNNATIVVAEVGAVDEEKEYKYGYNIDQFSIDSFNVRLLDGSNYSVIDFWQGNESEYTTDGIHYSNEEYNKTLDYLKENL